jgi:hypothetical protein
MTASIELYLVLLNENGVFEGNVGCGAARAGGKCVKEGN